MYDAGKSLVDVAMFRLQPLEGAILVKFEVDGEVPLHTSTPAIEKPHIPNYPTFYEIMTSNLDS